MVVIWRAEPAAPATAQGPPDPAELLPESNGGHRRSDVPHSQVSRQRGAPGVKALRRKRIDLSL